MSTPSPFLFEPRPRPKPFKAGSARLHPLYEEALRGLLDRLSDLKKQPQNILFQEIGAEKACFLPAAQAFAPFLTPDSADSSFDLPPFLPCPLANHTPDGFTLYVNFMDLHRCNALEAHLHATWAQMKAGDLFLAVFPGGETLCELRTSLWEAENALFHRVSPRLHPTLTLQTAQQLLQQAGFAAPVADRLQTTALYQDLFALIRDLRAMGETNSLAARPRGLTAPDLFREADKIYKNLFNEKNAGLQATYELIFLHGLKN